MILIIFSLYFFQYYHMLEVSICVCLCVHDFCVFMLMHVCTLFVSVCETKWVDRLEWEKWNTNTTKDRKGERVKKWVLDIRWVNILAPWRNSRYRKADFWAMWLSHKRCISSIIIHVHTFFLVHVHILLFRQMKSSPLLFDLHKLLWQLVRLLAKLQMMKPVAMTTLVVQKGLSFMTVTLLQLRLWITQR